MRSPQRREILEMDWLIDDIRKNGAASTPAEAQERPVPDYDVTADRCATPTDSFAVGARAGMRY